MRQNVVFLFLSSLYYHALYKDEQVSSFIDRAPLSQSDERSRDSEEEDSLDCRLCTRGGAIDR